MRACTGEVWVRSTRWSSAGSVQNVSCMVRAGWSGPRLRASKLSHSASSTGPSATSQPMATKMSAISSEPVVSGCRAPVGTRSVGRVTSTVSSTSIRCSCSASSSSCRLRERLLHGPARLADALAGLLARLRRQRPDLAVGQGQRRPVAGVLDPDLLQRLEVGGARDRGERGVARGLDLLGLQRGHLHGVEVGVRSGHVGESRNRRARPSERVGRAWTAVRASGATPGSRPS